DLWKHVAFIDEKSSVLPFPQLPQPVLSFVLQVRRGSQDIETGLLRNFFETYLAGIFQAIENILAFEIHDDPRITPQVFFRKQPSAKLRFARSVATNDGRVFIIFRQAPTVQFSGRGD